MRTQLSRSSLAAYSYIISLRYPLMIEMLGTVQYIVHCGGGQGLYSFEFVCLPAVLGNTRCIQISILCWHCSDPESWKTTCTLLFSTATCLLIASSKSSCGCPLIGRLSDVDLAVVLPLLNILPALRIVDVFLAVLRHS